jgi:hypothetical protein
MTRRGRDERRPADESGLLEANYASLNERFYDTRPWVYFQQRLAHLILVASDRDRYSATFAEGRSTGFVSAQGRG